MKIPKMFIPERNLEKNVKKLLSEKPLLKSYNELTVSSLLKSCKTFLGKQGTLSSLLTIYSHGENLAEELNFTKGDLEELSQRITSYDNKDKYLGFYLSALVNKIITKEEQITLKLNAELFGIGAYLKKGRVTVEGGADCFFGHCMEGGELVSIGDIGHCAANGMMGGKLIVHGNAGMYTGVVMRGGDIMIYGKIGGISVSCEGTIYQNGKKVWSK